MAQESRLLAKLGELVADKDNLSPATRERLQKVLEEGRQRELVLRQSIATLNESLANLRLAVKYNVFDLEATRRENQYLRNMIERLENERLSGGGEQGPDSDQPA